MVSGNERPLVRCVSFVAIKQVLSPTQICLWVQLSTRSSSSSSSTSSSLVPLLSLTVASESSSHESSSVLSRVTPSHKGEDSREVDWPLAEADPQRGQELRLKATGLLSIQTSDQWPGLLIRWKMNLFHIISAVYHNNLEMYVYYPWVVKAPLFQLRICFKNKRKHTQCQALLATAQLAALVGEVARPSAAQRNAEEKLGDRSASGSDGRGRSGMAGCLGIDFCWKERRFAELFSHWSHSFGMVWIGFWSDENKLGVWGVFHLNRNHQIAYSSWWPEHQIIPQTARHCKRMPSRQVCDPQLQAFKWLEGYSLAWSRPLGFYQLERLQPTIWLRRKPYSMIVVLIFSQ